jgi:hypothetical protein
VAALKLSEALVRAQRDFAELGAAFALVGGLAVSARAEPRTTRDVDFAVSVNSDGAAELLIRQLQARGYAVNSLIEQTATGRIATVRLNHVDSPRVIVDLLFASSGIEVEVVARAEPLEILGAVLPVATVDCLMVMKLLARNDRTRPQDWDDLRALWSVATPGELASARELAALVMSRGTHRNRNLLELLDAAAAEFGPRLDRSD